MVGSASNLAGKRFEVLRGSRVVLRGRLRRASGTPAPWRRAFRADMTSLAVPGRYVVRVGRLRSRPWVVQPGGSRDAIPVALGFFEANRDGMEPSPIHGPAHLNDAVVESGPYQGQRFDLTGGWMDAGDTLKFAGPTAFATIALQTAARLDPVSAARLNDEADVGVRFLLKLHPAQDLFIAQIGRAAIDYLRDPQEKFNPADDDKSSIPGIRQKSASIGVGSDQAGKVAAALAMAAPRFSGDARDRLIAEARAWYEHGGALERPGDKLDESYVETVFQDDMAAGAAMLFRATGEAQYLADALEWLKGLELGGGWTWDHSGAFTAAELCGLLGSPPIADETARSAVCQMVRDELTIAQDRFTDRALGPAGALYWGSIAPSNGVGALAAAAARAAIFPGAPAIAARARDWLFGLNPWGVSFMARYGPFPPQGIHHWAIFRGRGLPIGAVVGGPAPMSNIRTRKLKMPKRGRFARFNSASAAYDDNAANYVTSEPAIDYSATAVVLLAALAGAPTP